MKDYSELIAECTHRSNVGNFVERADMFADMAVRTLSRRLRLVEQEKELNVITNGNGDVNLPNDFEEMRGVFINGRELRRAMLAEISHPNAREIYAIAGTKLKSTNKQTEHQIDYFASIPPLKYGQHFLLRREPEICLYAMLFQAFAANGDIDKAAQAASWLDRLVLEVNNYDQSRRQGGARVKIAAVTP